MAFWGGDTVPVEDADARKQLEIIKKYACDTKIATEAHKNKTIGKTITLFGITIPLEALGIPSSWDGVAKMIMKDFIKELTDNTVDWINTGFDGNPLFVQDPKKFFSNTADGLADDFIDNPNSPLKFLCEPFADKIRASLTTEYYQSTRYQPQCTFTGIGRNLDDFYNKFSTGGWDAWFSMTQNPNNNPYDSYLKAKVELDSQIASRLEIDEQKLQWGKGFMEWSDCAKYEQIPNPNYIESNRPDGANEIGNTPTVDGPTCIERGPTKTPGSVIEGRLQKVLGQNVDELGLARSFDDVVSALTNQLIKEVFSIGGGLLGGGSGSYRGTTVRDPRRTPPTTTPPPTSIPVGPEGFTFCAHEDSTCFFGGTRTIIYGANENFAALVLSNGSTLCSSSVFGDPAPGVVKACFTENETPVEDETPIPPSELEL